ncbi:uncharacterized protein PHALS_09760 [Plasmopara halstedii]|uniref:Uncharacterized protein n=1 Tax=Plasmopara halstedii TaxID=4781 RepID=A0A0P1AFM5_PLAHL|nr:uncharacterized protein PHALS_09760 [Plasmopara halstedii]CEG39518.1 hypothetical protein PHALS_09760 [Plasmopara halstedii]|eukprot:XP_024575887.1 hypothetical protein PHALS_09760 [Plasmopara halstedii]
MHLGLTKFDNSTSPRKMRNPHRCISLFGWSVFAIASWIPRRYCDRYPETGQVSRSQSIFSAREKNKSNPAQVASRYAEEKFATLVLLTL